MIGKSKSGLYRVSLRIKKSLDFCLLLNLIQLHALACLI